jgi:hypothetical protein
VAGQGHQRLSDGIAEIVDQHVQRAEVLDDPAYRALHLVRLRHVRHEGHHAAAGGLGEVGREAGHVLVGQAVDDNVRAGFREGLGYALANAPARTCHERDLAAQVELGERHRYGQTRSMNFCGARSPHCD